MTEATRGIALTRTGKTRRKVECTPPNKKCGGRCIPPDWDCRLEGKGTNPALKVVKNDPLAGAASIERGVKDITKGVTTLDPAKVQRGRSSVIRGIVKIAPGNSLEEKNKLRKRLEEGSSAAFALTLAGILGVVSHRTLYRYPFYRDGVGGRINRAGLSAVNGLLDITPGQRGPRNAIRGAATVAQIDLIRAARRGNALTIAGNNARTNLRRVGPLGFLGDRIGANNSPLLEGARLRNTMRELARNTNAEQFSQQATARLFSTRTGRGHNLFSESAAQTFINSEFNLGLGSVINPPLQRRIPGGLVNNAAADLTLTSRKDAVVTRLATRLQSWGTAMQADMRLRGYVDENGALSRPQIDRYIREQALPIIQPYTRSMGPNAAVAISNYERQMRLLIEAGDRTTAFRRLATGRYNATVRGFDSYFDDVVDRFTGGPIAASSPFGDGKVALAKYLRGSETYNPSRGTGYTRVVSREHANMLVADWHHRHSTKVRVNERVTQLMQENSGLDRKAALARARQENRDQKSPYVVQPAAAQRVAQVMQRSPELPSPEDALATLRRSGLRVQLPPSTNNAARRYGERSEAQLLASMMQETRVNRRGERVPRYASRAAALRALRARQQENNDTEDVERVDATNTPAKGKPCGKTHIPKEKKCHTPVTREQIGNAIQLAAVGIYFGGVALSTRSELRTAELRRKVSTAISSQKPPPNIGSAPLSNKILQLKGKKGVDDKVVDQVSSFVRKAGITVNTTANQSHYPATFGFWNPDKPNILNVPYLNSRGGSSPTPDMGRIARIGASTINRPQPLGLFRRWGVSNGASIGSSDQFMLTTIHELGHALHGRVGFSTPKRLRLNGRTYEGAELTRMLSRSITEYGASDLRQGRYEMFAEYFSMYVTNGNTLKKRNPVAWAWTKSIVDKATAVNPTFTPGMKEQIMNVVKATKEGRRMFDSAGSTPEKLLSDARELALAGKPDEFKALVDNYEGKLTLEQFQVIGSLYETAGIYAYTNANKMPDAFPDGADVTID